MTAEPQPGERASRAERAASFDRIPALYDRMRPGYPAAVYDDLLALTGLQSHSRVLEIGCGPGKFTEPLARRGLQIDAIEPGAALARHASQKLAPRPGVHVHQTPFESFTTAVRYDLVVAASSFHWLDPETRFERCADLLRPAGYLALCSNHHRRDEHDEFQAAVQQVYAAVAPALDDRVRQHQDFTRTESSPRFGDVVYRRYPRDLQFSSTDYVQLLNTYSDHLTLPDDVRERLFAAIVELIDQRFGGVVTRPYESILELRQKQAD